LSICGETGGLVFSAIPAAHGTEQYHDQLIQPAPGADLVGEHHTVHVRHVMVDDGGVILLVMLQPQRQRLQRHRTAGHALHGHA
jgi:hypothetical protein